jgi:hypothetical protein
VCYQNPAFRQTLAQLIVQIAGDAELGAKACEFAQQLQDLDHYQVATVFHKTRMFAIDRQILSGKYDGRVADTIYHLRRKFRFEFILSESAGYVSAQPQHKTGVINRVCGSMAAFNNEVCDLGFDMADVNNWNNTTPPDPIALVITGYEVKRNENEWFTSYLCEHDSLAARLLGHADPRIAAIMSKTSDAMGNPVSGDALSAMHLLDLEEYFAITGQPDLSLPFWDRSEQPFNVNLDNSGGVPSGTFQTQNGSCMVQ